VRPHMGCVCRQRAAQQLTRYFTLRPRLRAALPRAYFHDKFAVKGADMPAPCFARLRHVVNNRDVK
jgi:hypothetical protein